jgi:four helix bundle protein
MEKNSSIKHFRDLIVYQQAFDKANEIYEITKSYPKVEMFSMTDQIRRSSRSVCSNIAESWRKRRYKAMFISKLTDSMMDPV